MLMAISKGDTDYNMAVASQLVTINDAMLAKIEPTSPISEPDFVDQRVLVPQALSPNCDDFNDEFIIHGWTDTSAGRKFDYEVNLNQKKKKNIVKILLIMF
jgi:hypothetical protein